MMTTTNGQTTMQNQPRSIGRTGKRSVVIDVITVSKENYLTLKLTANEDSTAIILLHEGICENQNDDNRKCRYLMSLGRTLFN